MTSPNNSLHICLTSFENQSRIIKEVRSLVSLNIVQNVYVAALGSTRLEKNVDLGPGIFVNRFRLITRNLGKNLFFQIIKYIEFLFRVGFYYKNKDISIINVHTVDLLPIGVLLKYYYGAHLVYDAHELETETNGLSGIRQKIYRWIESHFIKNVDLTIVVSEAIADWYESRYSIKRPVVVLNAPKRYALSKGHDYFRKKYNIPTDVKIILYQGMFAKGRGIELILDAVRMRDKINFAVVFMGYGALQSTIDAAALSCRGIYVHPAVPSDELLNYTRCADFGISLIERTCLSYYYCMPNKLFEFMAAGLPVIVSNMQEMSKLVRENKVGIVVLENNVDSLNAAIDLIFAEESKDLRDRVIQTANSYSWEVQEKKMQMAYSELKTKDS